MANSGNVVALMAVFFGTYCFAAALGGMFNPHIWERMLDDLVTSAYGQFLGGAVALQVGFALIAVVPPQGDWLNIVMFVVGCWAVFEGVLFMIVPGRVLSLFRPMLSRMTRPFALFAAAAGLFFNWAGASRL